MSLLVITLICMAVTLLMKWITASSLISKKSKLSAAMDITGQARFRLKTAVREVSINSSEIDKLKRKIKTSERRINKLQKEYQDYTSQAIKDAELNAEK
ncbi:MAG: hypothetical protein O3B73_17665, partial [bacterium]|nr:hypothetical protein [bacterium]